MTPLHFAASFGHINVCYFIIAMCKEMNNHFKIENLKNARGDTPLHYAAINSHLEVFSMVTSRIQNINPRNFDGYTPLHFAAGHGLLSVCQYIIDRVPDKNPMTCDKIWTPLHLSAANGQTAACQLLVKYNQRDVHLEDIYGDTPLSLARKFGYGQTARVLSAWKLKHRRVSKHKIDNYKM